MYPREPQVVFPESRDQKGENYYQPKGSHLPLNILGISTPPAAPTTPTQKIGVPVVQEEGVAAIADPVIALLKQLLPVDSPIGTLLERFRQAAALGDPDLPLEKPLVDITSLLRSLPVDLKTVTADQLRTVIERIGLRYEPMLQAALAQRIPLTGPQVTAQNLKAALLQRLGTQSSGETIETSSPAAPAPPRSTVSQPNLPTQAEQQQVLEALGEHARENLESFLVKQLEAQSRGLVSEEAEPGHQNVALTGSAEAKPAQTGTPIPELSKAGTPAAELPKAGRSVAELPEASDGLLRPDLLRQILMIVEAEAESRLKSAVLPSGELPSGTGLSHTPKADAGPPQPSDQVPTAAEPELTAEGLKQAFSGSDQPPVRQIVEQVLAQHTLKVTGARADEAAPPSAMLQQTVQTPGTVRQQAHELLTAIERTQVLNSINSERGEPVTFQIPFVLDGQTSTAQFYVERRLDEAHTVTPDERHYTVVALLDLSGLGKLRIDLALYRKQLWVKVTVEREQAAIFANRLLPELGQALGDQGFAVEFLKCERTMQDTTGGEELRDRILPEKGLLNLRV